MTVKSEQNHNSNERRLEQWIKTLCLVAHNQDNVCLCMGVCVCVCVLKMWHKTVHLHKLLSPKASLHAYRLYECIHAKAHASVNVCVCVCVCMFLCGVRPSEYVLIVLNCYVLDPHIAHLPVNGCSGACAVWHSFEYWARAHTHTHTHTHWHTYMHTTQLHLIIYTFYKPCGGFLRVCDHASLTVVRTKKDRNHMSFHYGQNLTVKKTDWTECYSTKIT